MLSAGYYFYMNKQFRLLLFLTALLIARHLFAAQEIVSQSAVLIGDYAITTREVLVNEAIDQLLNQKEELKLPEVSSAAFKEELSQVVTENVVYREAIQFNAKELDEIKEEYIKADAAVSTNLKKLKNTNKWDELEVSGVELARVLKEKLVAKKFLKFKREASLVTVSDEEALQYYRNNRSKFGASPFANFKENIKSYLATEHADERLRSWFSVLAKKYRVRNLFNE